MPTKTLPTLLAAPAAYVTASAALRLGQAAAAARSNCHPPFNNAGCPAS